MRRAHPRVLGPLPQNTDSASELVLTLTDPREAPAPRWLAGTARLLNDPRDVYMIWLMLQCAAVACVGVSLFFVTSISVWYVAPLYWALLMGAAMDRFTLMLHCTSHRQLFGKEHR